MAAAREALARHAWSEAFELLTAADASVLTGEDLRGLARAAWWIGRLDEAIESAERGFARHLEESDSKGAALAAIDLAHNYHAKGRDLVAAGWLKRAERLLQDQSESPAHGYLAREKATSLITKGRYDEALEEARRTLDIGMRFGDRDVQALGLHDQGRALVAMGKVAEGWDLLDEATMAAVSGELDPYSTAVIYCNTISTCRNLADYRRAGEWSEAARRWCERQAISGFPGMCRVYRAEISRLRGAWADAEREARSACIELMDFNREYAAGALYELGEVRFRLGDLPGAEEAFGQAHEMGKNPQPGLALLRLAQGNRDAALSSIHSALEDETWDRLARARLLPAQVEIAAEAGDLAAARTAADELEQIAADYGTTALQAAAATSRGRVLLAEGEAATALRSLREGQRLWQEIDAPYEAALTRVAIGQARRASGDEATAVMELRAALSAFERLGAVDDARGVDDLLVASDARTSQPVLRTFVFTDIVGSTPLVEAIGDEAWNDLLRWHDQTLTALFGAHGAEHVDHTGDGFFVSFPDAGAAVEAAVAIQRSLAEHRREHGFSPQVRIGIHATEAGKEGARYRGKGVHEAARIGALAEGGEILVSRSSVEGVTLGYALLEARTVNLKGISQPIEVVAIDWR